MSSVPYISLGRAPALYGGRAPARFSSQMRHAARAHHTLSRVGSWMQAFTGAVPALRRTPTYGALLGNLADRLLHPRIIQQPHVGSRRPLQREVAAPVSRAALSGPQLSPGAGRSATWSPASVIRMAPKGAAGSSGWMRNVANASAWALFGMPVRGHGSSESHSVSWNRPAGLPGGPIASPAHLRQQVMAAASAATRSMFEFEAASRASPPPSAALLGMDAVRDWQGLLAERIAARITELTTDARDGTLSSGMQDLWALPIDGPAACSELLCQAASGSVEGVGNWSGPLSISDAMPSMQSPPASVDSVVAMNSPLPRQVASGSAEIGAVSEASALLAMQESGEQLLARAQDGQGTPVLVPSARRMGQRASTPAPAVLTRTALSAPQHRDSDWGEEDLIWLSQKMKRVLEEEARRHGIDV
jgi:hypothetical protein